MDRTYFKNEKKSWILLKCVVVSGNNAVNLKLFHLYNRIEQMI